MGEKGYEVIRELVDLVVQVSEEEIKRAMRLTMERAKLVIEPGAAVAIAAACLKDDISEKFGKGLKVGIVVCGGNVDLDNLDKVLN